MSDADSFRRLLEFLPEPVFILDAGGIVSDWPLASAAAHRPAIRPTLADST